MSFYFCIIIIFYIQKLPLKLPFLESKRFCEKREDFKIKSVNKLLKGFDDH